VRTPARRAARLPLSLALAALLLALPGAPGRAAYEEIPGRDLLRDPSLAPRVFPVGERLRFGIRYGPVRAGDAVMEVLERAPMDGHDSYHIRSTAVSSRFFTTFFPVDDCVETWMDAKGLFSRGLAKRLREGRYRQDLSVRFDHERNLAVYHDGAEVPVPPRVQDVLSAFYFVRMLNLRVGQEIHIDNHDKKKNYPLKVQVLREERVKTPAGTFSCFVIEPLLKTAGLFKQEGRMTIWVTNDDRKIPVLMKSKVKVGSIIAELESIEMTATGEEAER
jgi:hypothetical protein